MKKCGAILAALFLLMAMTICAAGDENTLERLDYSKEENWAYCETGKAETSADVFFLSPSAFGGKEGSYMLELTNEKGRNNFIGSISMEKGIYDGNARFFAPFYRQTGYNVARLPEAEAEPMKQKAFADVKDAFLYYMNHLNEGRPFILAGFSQGAEMAIRLMKACFDDEALQKKLIACYAVGWHLTEEETQTFPQLKAARGEKDLGVIVSFDAEAEEVESSVCIPAGMKTLAINPLNWKTGSEKAGKEMNLGACFTDYSGEILEEVPALTGAYLDERRGALKVTDIDPAAYAPTIPILGQGEYHLYDYQFFYRNLEKNVQDRIEAYLALHSGD